MYIKVLDFLNLNFLLVKVFKICYLVWKLYTTMLNNISNKKIFKDLIRFK